MKTIYVPWLHMHQPLIWWKIGKKERLISNLEKMLLVNQWNGKLIARAYKNPAKYVLSLKEEGYEPRIMLDFSGILLEALDEIGKKLNKTYVNGEKIGNIVKLYKRVLKKYPEAIEFAGSAYSHCYFPVVPIEDYELQINEWKKVFKRLFGQKALKRIKGFWLPEMGIPGDEDRVYTLIKFLKDSGYEWIILPTEALKEEKKLTYEQRIQLTSEPHTLKVRDESIIVILKVRYDFLDQQAGCDADCVYEKCLEAARIHSKNSPALVVPASDGENGNVMMNEFFPQTFVPFFKKKVNKNVESMCVSEFLENFYKDKELSRIKLKKTGGSWMGGHENWIEGRKRVILNRRIQELSKEFHNLSKKNEKIKRIVLIAETSCYTYWNTSFWFLQGEKTVEYAYKLMKSLY